MKYMLDVLDKSSIGRADLQPQYVVRLALRSGRLRLHRTAAPGAATVS